MGAVKAIAAWARTHVEPAYESPASDLYDFPGFIHSRQSLAGTYTFKATDFVKRVVCRKPLLMAVQLPIDIAAATLAENPM